MNARRIVTHAPARTRTPRTLTPTAYDALPLSKRTRIWLEAVRTIAAVGAMSCNGLVLLRVFKVI